MKPHVQNEETSVSNVYPRACACVFILFLGRPPFRLSSFPHFRSLCTFFIGFVIGRYIQLYRRGNDLTSRELRLHFCFLFARTNEWNVFRFMIYAPRLYRDLFLMLIASCPIKTFLGGGIGIEIIIRITQRTDLIRHVIYKHFTDPFFR